MDGMGMLLKAAGFDPDQFQLFIKQLQSTIVGIKQDIETIKSNQQTLLNKLEDYDHGKRN